MAKSVERAKQVELRKENKQNPLAQGPVVDDIQLQKILGYIQSGKREGARLAYGGAKPAGEV